MTPPIALLTPPVVAPPAWIEREWVEAGESVGVAFVELVEGAMGSVTRAAELDPMVLGDVELEAAFAGATTLGRQADCLRLALLAEADRRRAADSAAATGTDAWAAALTGDAREVMRGGLKTYELLMSTYAATREAFKAGKIGLPQVKTIVNAAEQAPDDATPEQVRVAEELLVARATGEGNRNGKPINQSRLRRAARRMFDPIDRDLADRHEARMLGREEKAAEAEAWFRLGDNGDGTWSGRFRVPELNGNLLNQALERLSAPRRMGRNPDDPDSKAGPVVVDPSAPTTTNYEELLGLALCELIEHLPTLGHASNGTTMVVRIDLDRLLDGLGAAGLDRGVAISAVQARRLACEAGIIPVVMGGASVALDVGRSRRLHSTAQRNAAAAIYDTCGIEGCERPFAWCEMHHATAWAVGGGTDVAHLVPLCGHHHRRAHDERFELQRAAGVGWRLHPRR